jgi:hypothetical protein
MTGVHPKETSSDRQRSTRANFKLGRYPMLCSQPGKRQRPSARRAYLGLVQRVRDVYAMPLGNSVLCRPGDFPG